MDRKFLRPGWIVGHLFVVLAVLVCLRLGRWQWDRTEHGGTIQNLGYAVLWPVFGAAFVYMWFRFLQLEQLKDAEDDAELTALAAGGSTAPPDGAAGSAPATTATVAVESPAGPAPDPTPPAVRSGGADPSPDDDPTRSRPAGRADDDQSAPAPTAPVPRGSRTTPSTGVTVAVAMVGGDDDDDPELAAYNRALAALAEKDHRRAR